MFKQRVQAESDDLIQKLEAGYKALKSGRMSKQDYSALVDATEKKLDQLLDQYETDTRTLRKAQSFAGSADSKEFSQMSNKIGAGGFAELSRAKQVSVPKGAQQVSRSMAPADLDDNMVQALVSGQSRSAFETCLPLTKIRAARLAVRRSQGHGATGLDVLSPGQAPGRLFRGVRDAVKHRDTGEAKNDDEAAEHPQPNQSSCSRLLAIARVHN